MGEMKSVAGALVNENDENTSAECITMNAPEPVRVIRFAKKACNGLLFCEVEVFADHSAYVTGEGIEMGFEESPDAWKHAIEYLELLGYERNNDAAAE